MPPPHPLLGVPAKRTAQDRKDLLASNLGIEAAKAFGLQRVEKVLEKWRAAVVARNGGRRRKED